MKNVSICIWKISCLIIMVAVFCLSCKEEYNLSDLEKEVSANAYSGSGYATGFETLGAQVFFAVDIPQTREYTLSIAYSTTDERTATASLYVNDTKVAGQLSMPPGTAENPWKTIEKKISLQKGIAYISIQRDSGDNGLFNLDYILIEK